MHNEVEYEKITYRHTHHRPDPVTGSYRVCGKLPATVAAAETQAHPGDTVNVAVTVADNPGMDVMKLKFSYDATVPLC